MKAVLHAIIGDAHREVGQLETRFTWGRIFVALAVLVIADLALAAGLGIARLDHAAHLLDDAGSSLGRDDLAEAEERLDDAVSSLRFSRHLLGHPGVGLAGLLPGLGDDLAALRSLVSVADSGVDAARDVTDTIIDLGGRELGVAGVAYRDGTFDLQAIDRLGQAVERVMGHLDAAADTLAASRAGSLLAPVERATEMASRRLGTAKEAAHRAVDAAALLPGIAGAENPRRYLLAFQSPSEARGGGGVIGVYGILSATEGRISLDEVAPIEALGPILGRPVEAPPSYTQLYGPLSALDDWRQANLSPTFPLTSEVLLRMFERVRHEQLDGVIALDPIALGHMSRGLPGLEAEGWDRVIDPDSARRLLLFDVYKRFVHQERQQNIYLSALIDQFWRRISQGDVEPGDLLRGLIDATSKHHLKMFSVAPDDQRLIESLGLTADPRTIAGPLQAIFHNNNSGNKLDFFLHRTQTTEIVLDRDGSAVVTATVELTNELPNRGVRAISRSGVASGLDRGENRMSVHFMLPRGARLESFEIDGSSRRPYRGRDGGFPIAWRSLTVGPDQSSTVSVTYQLEDAVDPADDTFWFTLWPQATARPDVYRLSVTAPDLFSFETSAGTSSRGIEVTGKLKEPRSIRLQLSSI